MPTITNVAELKDVPDSDNDSSVGKEGAFISDSVHCNGHDYPPSGNWTFNTTSTCEAKVFQGLSNQMVSEKFELLYNPVDKYLQKEQTKR